MTKYTTTKATMFTTIIDILNAVEIPAEIAATYGDSKPDKAKEELIERLNHEIALLSKKTTSKANTEKAKADNALIEKIKETLADGTAKTVSEIQVANPDLSVAAGISNSKVTSLLGKLVTAGEVTRVKDKKKSLYSLA